ncbi:PTS sugar transporter subunit IIA [Balneola vulgaris]|uniref:PTS sugar transporter subunit IIA n=1 Tax=Balneola vulgaris TaxID=287535 RepID=UPI001F097C07|nr:PTS sugar transporter subunit IIA [Balneola vulgaris]
MDTKSILSELEVENKNDLISKLVQTLAHKVDTSFLPEIEEAVFERESVMSTGVGKGLAIPHGKSKNIEENYAAFAVLKQPLEFDSIDGQPVNMVFLLVGPDSKNSLHIKLLSRISRLMNSSSFRDKIVSCTNSQQILDAFKEEEEKYFIS